MVKDKLPNNSKKFDYGLVWQRQEIMKSIQEKEEQIKTLKEELLKLNKKLGF